MTIQTVPMDARRTDRWFKELPDKLDDAVKEYKFDSRPEFRPLLALSSGTLLESLDVDPRSITVAGKKWSAAGTAYIQLRDDINSDDPVVQADACPVTVRFRLEQHQVVIEGIDPDVSSFSD